MKIVITKQPPDEMQTFYNTGKLPAKEPRDEALAGLSCSPLLAGQMPEKKEGRYRRRMDRLVSGPNYQPTQPT